MIDTSQPATRPPLEREKDFRWMKNCLGFTSPSLFYPERRSYKQFNKFATVAAQFLPADDTYRRGKIRQHLRNGNSVAYVEHPVSGINVAYLAARGRIFNRA